MILIRWNVILFRCIAKCFPTFPIKVGSKKIFFIQITTLCYNSCMTPELFHILLKNVILFSRPISGTSDSFLCTFFLKSFFSVLL